MRLYIAGPMTGLPDYNRPAFYAAAELLRSHGHDVENPADNKPVEESHAAYMRMSIDQILTCEGIVRLEGWSLSKGAVFEDHMAEILGIRRYDIGEFAPTWERGG